MRLQLPIHNLGENLKTILTETCEILSNQIDIFLISTLESPKVTKHIRLW